LLSSQSFDRSRLAGRREASASGGSIRGEIAKIGVVGSEWMRDFVDQSLYSIKHSGSGLGAHSL
jgi:hypothetical protein